MKLELRGDDIRILNLISKYIASNKEYLTAYLEYFKKQLPYQEQITHLTCIDFNLKGNDVEALNEILELIPSEREDILGYICFIRNQIAKHLGYDMKLYDMSLWNDDEYEKFVNSIIEEHKFDNI